MNDAAAEPTAKVSPADPVAPAKPVLAPTHLDFLKLAVASSEGHLRAFDTKAQIALAAFVLSLNPLWAMLRAPCAPGASSGLAAVLLLFVVATILAYGSAVWPVSARRAKASGLFFVTSESTATASAYLQRLGAADIPEQLADEILKLASLRQGKARRLKLALVATMLTYGALVALYLSGTQCG